MYYKTFFCVMIDVLIRIFYELNCLLKMVRTTNFFNYFFVFYIMRYDVGNWKEKYFSN